MPLKIPKWLVSGILKTFTLIQEVLKLSKIVWQKVLAIENNTLFFY
jgi:high-affinity nickel permease